MKEQHWQDLLAIYALGGATEEEVAEVERVVAVNSEAAAFLAELEQTVGAIPYMVEPMPVSDEATEAVMARVAGQSRAVEQIPAPISPANRAGTKTARPSWWQQLQSLWQQPAFAATAVALAAIVLVWSLTLQGQVQSLQQELAEVNAEMAATTTALTTESAALAAENTSLTAQIDILQLENEALAENVVTLSEQAVALRNERDAVAADLAALESVAGEMETAVADQRAMREFFDSSTLYTVSLPGTDEFPEAEAQLVVDPESRMAMLVVAGLNPLPEDNVYQVLLIRGTEHETAETFRVSTEGGGVLLVRSEEPIESFDAVGVSIEPEGGSVQRTGDIVVLGEVAN